MRHLALCLAIACVSAQAGEASIDAPPPGLTAEQAGAWERFAKQPGVKSISFVQLHPALLYSPSITLNIKGRTYVLEGRSERYEGQPFNNEVTGQRGIGPGGVRWISKVDGFLTRSDDGVVSGQVYLGGQRYLIVGLGADAVFLVESSAVRLYAPPVAPASAASRAHQ